MIIARLAVRNLSRRAAPNTTKKTFAELPAAFALPDGTPAPPLLDWHAHVPQSRSDSVPNEVDIIQPKKRGRKPKEQSASTIARKRIKPQKQTSHEDGPSEASITVFYH